MKFQGLRKGIKSLYGPALAVIACLALVPCAHAEIDLQNGCKGPSNDKLAAKLCDEYDLSPQFRQSQPIQMSKAECLQFFNTAIEAVNLICSYGNDVAAFTKKAKKTPKKAGVGKANTSEATVGQLNADSAALGQKYLTAFSAKYTELREAAETYDSKGVTPIYREGQLNENLEMSCKGDQVKSPAPGPAEVGLAFKAHDELQKTYENVRTALRSAADSSKRLTQSSGELAAAAKNRASTLTGLKGGGKAAPYNSGKSDKDDDKDDDKADENDLTDPANSNLALFAQDFISPLLKYKFGSGIGGIAGLTGTVAYQLIVYHQISYGQMIIATASAVNAGLGLGAFAAQTIYNKNQEKLERYRSFFSENYSKKTVTSKVASEEWGKKSVRGIKDYNCRVNYPE